MAYWKFDLNLINLAALPAGTDEYAVTLYFSETNEDLSDFFEPPFPASQPITFDTRDPNPWSQYPPSPFELESSGVVWVNIEGVSLDGGDWMYTLIHTLGPYTVGDVGTEVPPP